MWLLRSSFRFFVSAHSVWLIVRLRVTDAEWQPIREAALPRPGSPICADSTDSIRCCTGLVCTPIDALKHDGLSTPKTDLAQCLCFLCNNTNNNSILWKHLVSPFLLKCAKSFSSHGTEIIWRRDTKFTSINMLHVFLCKHKIPASCGHHPIRDQIPKFSWLLLVLLQLMAYYTTKDGSSSAALFLFLDN